MTGLDILEAEQFARLRGLRAGLITNLTGRNRKGQRTLDLMRNSPHCTLIRVFSPEHGLQGDLVGKVGSTTDLQTGLSVDSLYGETRRPTPEKLKGLDILIFDIQDVGARFYTYESTMSLAMEAAAEKRIPFIVLDRPNPIDGEHMSGFVLDDSLRSFVGLHRIPIRHGMTIGELATLVNSEGWLANGVKANLIVVKTEGWSRHQWYDQTGLRWINPSPNMKSLATATVYPGTCLFEGTNLSEGRGTDHPFEQIGAPFVEGKRWAGELARLKIGRAHV